MHSLEIPHILFLSEVKVLSSFRSSAYLIKPTSKNKTSFLGQKIHFSRMDIKSITKGDLS